MGNSIIKRSLEEAIQSPEGGDVGQNPPKQRRMVCDGDVDEDIARTFTCPITYELPVDPVTALDGFVYERSAIEEFFKNRQGTKLLSPMTNMPLRGKKLVPAIQQKNQIQTMIDKGVLQGDLVEPWIEKTKAKKKVDTLLKQARGGDVNAMVRAALLYENGLDGVSVDFEEAFFWFEKASQAGSILGTASIGDMLCEGIGVPVSYEEGLEYTRSAAKEGSDYANYNLGMAYANGLYGLPVDSSKAIKKLEKCLSPDCVYQDMNDEYNELAQVG